jgi:hypothetical protein
MLGGLFRWWVVKLFDNFEFFGDGILASEQEPARSTPASGMLAPTT